MKKESESCNPSCFGVFDSVFPVDDMGLRRISDACFSCDHLKPCFQKAMASPAGLLFKEERVDQAYQNGLIGAFRRWSEKKNIRRMINDAK